MVRYLKTLGVIAAFFLAVFIICAGWALGKDAQGSVEAGLKLGEQVALVQKSIDIETSEIGNLKSRIANADQTREVFLLQTDTHNLLLSTLINQLNFPDDAVREIEKASENCQTTLSQLSGMLTDYRKQYADLEGWTAKSNEQRGVNEKNLAELSGREKRDKTLAPLVRQLKQFQAILNQKVALLEKLTVDVKDRIQRVEEINTRYAALAGQFSDRLKILKRKELLRRQTNPLISGARDRLFTDVVTVKKDLQSLLDPGTWSDMLGFIWEKGVFAPISLVVVLLMVILLARKCRSWLRSEAAAAFARERRWTRVVLTLAARTMTLSFVTLFLNLSCSFELFFRSAAASGIIVQILTLTLFVTWSSLFVTCISREDLTPAVERIRSGLRLVLVFIPIYLVARQALDTAQTILVSFRLLLEIGLYGWLVLFWKVVDRIPGVRPVGPGTIGKFLFFGVRFTGFGIAIGGIVLELLGYGLLAEYWYGSWGQTLAAIFWGVLGFHMLSEWQGFDAQGLSDTDAKGNAVGQLSTHWVARQLFGALFSILCLMGVLLAWSSKQTFFAGLTRGFTYTFQVGSMSFSAVSFVQALIVLVGVHFLARLWRRFFQKTILHQSGVDMGVRESMTTITVYAIWIFGIFIALHVFGLNTTTVAVAFGALGIGLGFGLQNIFNNFISGIILLFERPIQVGDDIEINGTWATVTKTNVRSTIVQTYDNATIIIPNADLISNQVINWSFKDKRLRRGVQVGVEYGSDIEKVRATLLEIADANPRILKYPKPDVIFNDFADSALIFTLRFWTFIVSFYSVETEVRFKIDALFKERGLVIAFPQQDIHIRSVPPGLLVQPAGREPRKE
ncbi:MAG: mechanosensitive ion channel domain-containing protein [Pseudomonadota bacterium]